MPLFDVGPFAPQPRGIRENFPVFEIHWIERKVRWSNLAEDYVVEERAAPRHKNLPMQVRCPRCEETFELPAISFSDAIPAWMDGRHVPRTHADASVEGPRYEPLTRPCPFCFRPSRVPELTPYASHG